MAVQLKHDIRGYHAGNISKRYLREAEAADEFELSSNEVIAYATAAGALYRLPRTSLIHRERMETFMKHLYKIPISGKVIEKKYVRLGEASVIYSIGRHRMIEMARAAGAVYKLGDGASGTVLVNLDIFDEYMEQFREMPVMMKHPLFNGKETEEYQNCEDLEQTIMGACDVMVKAFEEIPPVSVDSILKDASERVVFQIINTQQNKSFLEKVPHREFQDLSIVYRVVINEDKNGIQSTKVTDELAGRLGMNEEQLFKCAAENTRRLFPPTVRSMNDVMKDMFLKDGMPEEIAEMMIGEIPPEQTLWVISNSKGINGAVNMLYENELHDLAENLGSDYGIDVSAEEIRTTETETLKTTVREKVEVR